MLYPFKRNKNDTRMDGWMKLTHGTSLHLWCYLFIMKRCFQLKTCESFRCLRSRPWLLACTMTLGTGLNRVKCFWVPTFGHFDKDENNFLSPYNSSCWTHKNGPWLPRIKGYIFNNKSGCYLERKIPQLNWTFYSQSRAVTYLLEVLSELEPEERRKFLLWATGSPRLPVGGWLIPTPILKLPCS